MNRPSRFGTALSAIAIAAVVSGCAVGKQNRSSIFGSKIDHENIGLATRAQAALAEGQLPTAVDLAERAVANTPNDAGFRALLGNIYFAAGRFASAESAYRDSLTLIAGQPEVMLKLALVQIAQGRNAEAMAALQAGQHVLDPANLGLALALAGRADDAVAVLNQIARDPGADARVRQNLALAYGLAGDWTMARTVAAQDVPPDQLDSRIQQWMAMATPSRPSDQVAALTGVTPSVDQGMPQKLALHRVQQQGEAYAYAVAPQALSQPQQFTDIPVTPPPAVPEPAPVRVEAPAAVEAPNPVVAGAVRSLVAPRPVTAIVDVPAMDAQPVVLAAVPPAPELPTKFEKPIEPASYVAISDTVRRAAESARKAKGNSNAVVQLGAYSSPERVSVAWSRITKTYPALRNYTPMRAKFDGPKGTVWRLSIKGFGSDREARERCELLQSRGGNCFVRRASGDAPVQFASR